MAKAQKQNSKTSKGQSTQNTKSNNKAVFTGSKKDKMETPEWLKEAKRTQAPGKITELVEPSATQFEEVLPSLKAEKPSKTQLNSSQILFS